MLDGEAQRDERLTEPWERGWPEAAWAGMESKS